MAIAHHVIFGCYGFWLPNDPRGSWSKYVFSQRLRAYGGITIATSRESVAHIDHDHHQRLAAKAAMNYPSVELSDRQVASVARGFAEAILESSTIVYACSIMPDHVHLVIGERGNPMDQIIARLKSKATKQLNAEGIHPLHGEHTPWARSYWTVYLDDEEDVRRAMDYVEGNPVREGRSRQEWSFVSSLEC